MANRHGGKENRDRSKASKAANRRKADKAADTGDTLAKKATKGKLFITQSTGPRVKKVPAIKKSAPAKQKKTPAAANDEDEPDDQPLTPERAQQLLEELRVTKAKLAEEQTARKAAEDEAAKVQTKSKKRARKVKSIPRPKGTCGRQYHLRDAMRLGERKDGDPEKNLARKRRYSNILRTVRDIAILGGLKWRKGIRFQDPVALGAVYEVARNEEPFLERFENDWVTAQIISQFFMNRRRHEVKKGKGGKDRNNSPQKTTRKRVLGKVAPASENRGDRGSPGPSDQEGILIDVQAGQGKRADGENGDQADEDVEELGVGGDDSDPHSDSSDSEKDYGDEDEEDEEEDEEDEDEDEDEDEEDEEDDDDENEGRRRSSRKKQRLT